MSPAKRNNFTVQSWLFWINLNKNIYVRTIKDTWTLINKTKYCHFIGLIELVVLQSLPITNMTLG